MAADKKVWTFAHQVGKFVSRSETGSKDIETPGAA